MADSKMAPKKSGKKRKVTKRGSGAKVKAPTSKAPSEAASYLEQWRQNDNAVSVWKFNKNTQSWLIRHMYEADKVSKSSFDILLKYLEGLKGDSARSRIRSEANRRAIRYKQHQTKGSEEATEAENVEAETNAEVSRVGSTKIDEAEVDEEVRWKYLSEHDKRKEYKRARKVLESVK